MPNTKSPQVTFRYKISSNYAIHSIAGVLGALNSQGDVIVNLFSERAPIPRRQTYELKADGTLNKQPVDIEVDTAIIRDVIFGMAMEPETARSVGQWLIDRANEHSERILKATNSKGAK